MDQVNPRRALLQLFHRRGAGLIQRVAPADRGPATSDDTREEIADMTAAAVEMTPSGDKTKALLATLTARADKEVSS